jgi:rSAM/selenodomain-associated transferase 1
MSDTALVVVARYPQVGQTKTRLARVIGDEETARLYRAFLSDLAQRFAGYDYDLHWAYTPAGVDYPGLVAALAPEYAQQMQCFPQTGEDFGARLHNVFRWTYEHSFARTILIGSDSPHISRELVDRASRALDHADVVLGPADDGGYYLLGMREPHDVFSGIPMSTDVVARMTVAAAQRQQLTVELIDSLFDVDEYPDLLRLVRLLRADRTCAPATAAHLDSMRRLQDDNTSDASSYAAPLDLHRANQPL